MFKGTFLPCLAPQLARPYNASHGKGDAQNCPPDQFCLQLCFRRHATPCKLILSPALSDWHTCPSGSAAYNPESQIYQPDHPALPSALCCALSSMFGMDTGVVFVLLIQGILANAAKAPCDQSLPPQSLISASPIHLGNPSRPPHAQYTIQIT